MKTFGLYRFRSGYIFYARRLMPRLTDRAALDTYLKSDERVFCILPRDNFEKLKGTLAAPLHLLAEVSAGHRLDVLISNRQPGTASAIRQEFPDTEPAPLPPDARSETAP